MEQFVIDFINQFGYWGIGILMVLENFLLFIPSEVILACGGFMTTYFNMELWLVILSATLGSLVGAIILYHFGMLFTPEHLERLLSGKLGKVLRLKPGDISKANERFAQKGVHTVFFSRFIPFIRCLISIPAGTARMNIGVFLLLTTIGTSIWNSVLAWLGAVAGKSWRRVFDYFDSYSVIVIALIAVIFLIVHYVRRLRKKNLECDSEV